MGQMQVEISFRPNYLGPSNGDARTKGFITVDVHRGQVSAQNALRRLFGLNEWDFECKLTENIQIPNSAGWYY